MRSCLPLTALSPQLVDNAILHPLVKRELLIRETEQKMIAGADAAWWNGEIGTMNDTRFFAKDVLGVDFSALEHRILGQLAKYGTIPSKMGFYGSPTGRGSYWPWNRQGPIHFTTQELSKDYVAEKLKKHFVQDYAAVDAWATTRLWEKQHVMVDSLGHVDCKPGCTICGKPKYEVQTYGLQWQPDMRRFVHNYDALFPR